MSTIQVTNISDGTISVPSTVVTEGGAKVLAVYDQVTPATDRGYNVSSISDDVTGYWTVNFTNNFDAVDYAHTAWAYSVAAGHPALEVGKANGDTWTTSATQLGTYYTPTAAMYDTENAMSATGDLA